MIDIFYETVPQATHLFLVSSIVFSLLQCFVGYLLLKFWVTAIGFLLGFSSTALITAVFMEKDLQTALLLGVLVGAVLAFLAFKLYLAGVFIVCGTNAFFAVLSLPFPIGGAWDLVPLVLSITAFLVAGYCSMRYARLWIIGTTAITGAFNGTNGLRAFVALLAENIVVFFLAAICLSTAGIWFQLKTTKASEKPKKASPETPSPAETAA